MIYFDNAATTMIKPKVVIKAVSDALEHCGNPQRGVNTASLNTSRVIFETRELITELINGSDPSNVAFTINSTMALNTAIFGTVNKGDIIITTVLEHNSVLRPCYALENDGIELNIIAADKKGNLLYDNLFSKIEECNNRLNKNNKIVVIINHSSNLTGNVVDLNKIGKVTKKYNCLFIVDASQTLGLIDIDVKKSNIDILCFTGHKSLYGPQGTGGLYVKENIEVRPLIVGGSGVKTYSKTHPLEMPTRLEAGTMNSHCLYGLNASLKYFKNKIHKVYEHDNELRLYFYNSIKNNKHIRFYGDNNAKIHSPIVPINIDDFDSSFVGQYLNENDIVVRTGGHCAPLMHKALGTDEQGIIRFSFGYFNKKTEIDKTVKVLNKFIKENCK